MTAKRRHDDDIFTLHYIKLFSEDGQQWLANFKLFLPNFLSIKTG